jgi:hypothetical protein
LICDSLNVAKHICYDMEEAVKGKLWKKKKKKHV